MHGSPLQLQLHSLPIHRQKLLPSASSLMMLDLLPFQKSSGLIQLMLASCQQVTVLMPHGLGDGPPACYLKFLPFSNRWLCSNTCALRILSSWTSHHKSKWCLPHRVGHTKNCRLPPFYNKVCSSSPFP